MIRFFVVNKNDVYKVIINRTFKQKVKDDIIRNVYFGQNDENHTTMCIMYMWLCYLIIFAKQYMKCFIIMLFADMLYSVWWLLLVIAILRR